jgi:hypothetical protein
MNIRAILVSGVLLGLAGSGAFACDNSSLNGSYAFKSQGAAVGVLDSAGVLHPFASPQLINAVGEFTFNGDGTFTRVDYAMSNGVPSPGVSPITEGGFFGGRAGTYSVAEDCTGMLMVNLPGGVTLVHAFALVDYGRAAYSVLQREHLPGLPAAVVPAGANCDSGCDLGINVATDWVQNVQNTNRRR